MEIYTNHEKSEKELLLDLLDEHKELVDTIERRKPKLFKRRKCSFTEAEHSFITCYLIQHLLELKASNEDNSEEFIATLACFVRLMS